MENSYKDYALAFKSMSDETRLKIIEMLSCGQMCACEILDKVGISQSTLSYHMKMLADCGLVNATKDGSWMRYTLNQDKVNDILKYITQITSEKSDCICNNGSCSCGI